MIAVDTNVLIYAHRAETDHHAAAAAELTRIATSAQPWALPNPCIAEFVRVVTHRRRFHPPSTLPQAFGFLEGVMASPGCVLLRPGSDFARRLRATAERADARGHLIFDAQIAALCEEHGISTILTADRDFLRFPGLEVRLLQATNSPGV